MTEHLPLQGLKVLELASVLAGPGVGMFFAELGAEVIKIENITTQGDVTRKWKLPAENPATDISSYFSCVNWGKSSVALDLSGREGLEIIYRLTAWSDLVLVSYKPGDAEKLGVGYDSLKRHNERLIYAHITGYGLKNPRAGFDAIIQAETGFTYMNGEPGGPPTKMPVALMDVLAAHHLKEAILLALLDRERSGRGHYIQASLFKAGLSSLANQASNWLVGKSIPQRMGSDHPNIVPYGTIYRTKDHKDIVLAAGTDKQYKELVKALGRPDLAEDPRFSRNQDRVIHKAEINRIIQSCLETFNRDEVLQLLAEKRIPAGGVFNMHEVFQVPESASMVMNATLDDGSRISGVRSVAFETSYRFACQALSPPPHYGQHSRKVLKNKLQMSEKDIDQLIKKGVVYAREDEKHQCAD